MNNEKIIQDLIDRIVLVFNTNEFVLDIIKKLRSIYDYKNIIIEGNTIRFNYKNFNREITVDDNQRKIVLKDYGRKTEDNKKCHFQNEFTYSEDKSKYSITRKSSQNDFIKKADKLIIDNQEYYSIDGYNDNKRAFYSSHSLNRKYERNSKDEFNLLESRDIKKDFYLLANGDILKIINTNGNERYFYCDSSEMNEEDLKNSKKAKFNVELNKSDAKTILENLNDAYKLINNDIIYGIRGSSY